ncbi:P-loop containing nucleoside triphosphate hydrolase protein [Chytridium lagenaria]|nr:P-loop containing nucleoside triphosphate hydrolase protein [Chytridium lagenaria]
MLVAAALYYPISKQFLASTRSFKRLESSTRAPVFSSFNEAITGAVTIRSFSHDSYILQILLRRLDDHHAAFLPLWATNRWLAFRVECVGALVAFLAGVGMTMGGRVGTSNGNLDAGWFGLALNYAGMLTDVLTWLVRNSASLEMSMTSVERIKEYIDMEQEAPRIIRSSRPPSNWPSRGEIHFKDLEIRYASHLPPAVTLSPHPSTLTLGPGQRIGLVGRTGSGKTTLGMAVLRLVEPWRGRMEVDGIDVCALGTEDVRRRIAVIPQDPFLFRGTLRENLDPLNLYTDADLLTVLSRFDLLQDDPSSPLSSLNGSIDVLGSNISAGQRQIISVARTILKMMAPRRAGEISGGIEEARRRKGGGGVLIMDEATSNLDPKTEKMVMEAVDWAVSVAKTDAEAGSSAWTVLVIAHRLASVVGLDRVLVLAKEDGETGGGRILEDGKPAELIASESGPFFELWRQSGINDRVSF